MDCVRRWYNRPSSEQSPLGPIPALALADYDPLNPAVRTDPYPYYRYLREQAPVKFVPSLNAYAVSRHEDVLLNHETFSSDPLIQLAFGEFNPAGNARYLLSSDPPEHTRLRALVNKAFSKRYIAEMQDQIRDTVKRLFGRHRARQGIRLHGALCVAASRVGGRQYLGRGNLDARGVKLSADEILAMCVLLLIAGNETTTNLLANALICLQQFSEQAALVRADRSLIPRLVEESLRFISPVQLLFRRATADTEIAGVKIAKDAIVMPIYASANRDDAVFPNPDHLDVRRPDLRKHLAFSSVFPTHLLGYVQSSWNYPERRRSRVQSLISIEGVSDVCSH